MDFGWPNVEIGRKMTNGQLLFLALHVYNLRKYLTTILDFNLIKLMPAFHWESPGSKILNSKGDMYCNMNRCILYT